MGDEAKAISFSNYKNTPINIKCLLGKQFNEPEVNLHLEAKNNSRQPRGGRIPCSGSREGGPASDKAELFGASSGGGATPAPAGSAAAARAGATGAEDAANEAMRGLQERGEKLSQLAEKTQMLEDSASEFEKMCKDLEKQQRGRWF